MITITTTGYSEVHPMTVKGRLLSIALMIFGIGVFIYIISFLPEFFWERLELERSERRVRYMRDHIVVCGFGKLAQELICRLDKSKLVIIDESPVEVDRAREMGLLAVMGDATQEEVLRKAGVERARALLATLDSDAKNFVVAMMAKNLNPDIYVIATARTHKPNSSFWRASKADALISPYVEAADKVAYLLSKPSTVKFIEVLSSERESLTLERIEVRNEGLVGKTLGELNVRRNYGVNVVLIQRGDRFMIPDANYTFQIGDGIFALGDQKALSNFERVLTGEKALS